MILFARSLNATPSQKAMNNCSHASHAFSNLTISAKFGNRGKPFVASQEKKTLENPVFIAVNSDSCNLLDHDRNAFEASNFPSLAANNVSFRNLFSPPRRALRSDAERAITFNEVTARDGTPLGMAARGRGVQTVFATIAPCSTPEFGIPATRTHAIFVSWSHSYEMCEDW